MVTYEFQKGYERSWATPDQSAEARVALLQFATLKGTDDHANMFSVAFRSIESFHAKAFAIADIPNATGFF